MAFKRMHCFSALHTTGMCCVGFYFAVLHGLGLTRDCFAYALTICIMSTNYAVVTYLFKIHLKTQS